MVLKVGLWMSVYMSLRCKFSFQRLYIWNCSNVFINEPVLSSTWSKMTPKNPYDNRGPVNTKSLDPWPLPQTSNRYSVLSYLPESTTKGDKTIPSKSEVRNLGNKHRPRRRQPVPNKYETGSEQEREGKTDSVQRQIPTLVNGQVCITKKSDSRQCVNDKSSNAQSVLRESSRRLLKKNEFTNPRKHKVLLVGDSHLRGCAAHMKSILNDQFWIHQCRSLI
jgi:hypothetical protein